MHGFFFTRGDCRRGQHFMAHGFGRGRSGGRFAGFGHFGDDRNPFGGNPFRGRERGRGGFGHGGLRLVLLKLIEDKPSHGYELIKAIEERFKGAYSPSPGVVYPTLSWLEDEGFITVTPGEDGRKQAQITDAGRAFLAERAEDVERLFDMMNDERAEHGDYAPLFRAMHNLKAALRTRGLKPLNKTEIEAIVDLIDDLAKKIERS
jgi:DNA-binding PadR family transcriptional regulator